VIPAQLVGSRSWAGLIHVRHVFTTLLSGEVLQLSSAVRDPGGGDRASLLDAPPLRGAAVRCHSRRVCRWARHARCRRSNPCSPGGSITASGAEAAEKRPFSSTGTASLLFRSSATTSVMAAMGSASYRCPVASPSSVRAPPVGHSLTRLRRLSRLSSSMPDRDASWQPLPSFLPWWCVPCNRVLRPCRFRAASLPSCSCGASIAAIHGPTSTQASFCSGASCPGLPWCLPGIRSASASWPVSVPPRSVRLVLAIRPNYGRPNSPFF